MSQFFEMVPLAKVLSHRSEFIEIDDFQTYKRCRVQLHAQGIIERDSIEGASIKTKKQQVCRTNEFLVAEIDAKLGGFGIIPANLDGAIVSSHYFLFEINEALLDCTFLEFYVKTPFFMEQVRAKGSTNYASVRPGEVLSYTIPLPPLEEQRRIVACIEELMRKIEEAKGLRRNLATDYEALCRSILLTASEDEIVHMPLKELVFLRNQDVTVDPAETYEFAGVYSFGRGIFRGQRKNGAEFAYTRLTRLHTNNFVYPKLMAWEGALGVVPPECDGLVVSPEFPVFEIDQSRVLPEVLDVYFRAPSIWPTLSGVSTGTNVRRRRLNPSDFLSFKMPLPSMRRQLLLKKVKNKIDTFKHEQTETEAELNALLPSILDKAFKGEL